MKGLAKLVVVPFWLGLGVVAALPPPASAVTCVGRVVAGDLQYVISSYGALPQGASFTPGAPVGASFRTGVAATTLTSVSVAGTAIGSSNGYVNVDIWSDNGAGTAPGQWIALVKRHVVIRAYAPAVPVSLVTAIPATTAPPIPLSPSTRYWIVLSDASDAPLGVPVTTWLGTETALLPATTNIDPGYSLGTTATGTWTSSAALGALTPFFEVRAC